MRFKATAKQSALQLVKDLDKAEPSTQSISNLRIDVPQAERHLQLCGIGPNDPVILCAYGGTNRHVPEPLPGGRTTTGS